MAVPKSERGSFGILIGNGRARSLRNLAAHSTIFGEEAAFRRSGASRAEPGQLDSRLPQRPPAKTQAGSTKSRSLSAHCPALL